MELLVGHRVNAVEATDIDSSLKKIWFNTLTKPFST